MDWKVGKIDITGVVAAVASAVKWRPYPGDFDEMSRFGVRDNCHDICIGCRARRIVENRDNETAEDFQPCFLIERVVDCREK